MAEEPGRRRTGESRTDAGFPALKARIIAQTGHHYYADKDDLLFDRLARRFRACGVPDSEAYLARLSGPEGAGEWSALEAEITIGETFFFRYAEQFEALRSTILPGLIAARKGQKTLRIWSAGCSTGAEPYSVAILVHELLGLALPDWRVTILGTDLSAAALATARLGEYGRWALRTLPPEERLRWFRPIPARAGALREGGYALRPEYRAMVRFERLNLLALLDGTVPEAYAAFDLILCRNVLIYFGQAQVNGMVRAFGQRLGEDGWLLLGHAEPNPAFAAWLAPVNLPGTVAYRPLGTPEAAPPLPAEPVAAPSAPPPAATPPSLARPLPVPDPLAPSSAPAAPPRPAAPDALMDIPAEAESDRDRVLSRIRALADAGEMGAAWRALSAALEADPIDPGLRYYQGLLARSLGREAEAERALRGALFLDRDFVMAHYQLGLLLSALGRRLSALRALDNALSLAQGLSPETVLPEGDGVTAGEMRDNLRHALSGLRRPIA
ncbi:CheR family methyltransferase [Methylobacterium organophilum]|uniref:protein-glutamate O-methyltransferase n=1 Tax=Methylobacterium organophilum TaxID=410 RepID=A0ABQ4TEY5_METOR|nr:protein-glutamate O-methyltransferase CheR [Methylobacterium organophilum]GJE29594.1 hypothetical protein LKMONMHP_4476 [Methylobacterium organophilum]